MKRPYATYTGTAGTPTQGAAPQGTASPYANYGYGGPQQHHQQQQQPVAASPAHNAGGESGLTKEQQQAQWHAQWQQYYAQQAAAAAATPTPTTPAQSPQQLQQSQYGGYPQQPQRPPPQPAQAAYSTAYPQQPQQQNYQPPAQQATYSQPAAPAWQNQQQPPQQGPAYPQPSPQPQHQTAFASNTPQGQYTGGPPQGPNQSGYYGQYPASQNTRVPQQQHGGPAPVQAGPPSKRQRYGDNGMQPGNVQPAPGYGQPTPPPAQGWQQQGFGGPQQGQSGPAPFAAPQQQQQQQYMPQQPNGWQGARSHQQPPGPNSVLPVGQQGPPQGYGQVPTGPGGMQNHLSFGPAGNVGNSTPNHHGSARNANGPRLGPQQSRPPVASLPRPPAPVGKGPQALQQGNRFGASAGAAAGVVPSAGDRSGFSSGSRGGNQPARLRPSGSGGQRGGPAAPQAGPSGNNNQRGFSSQNMMAPASGVQRKFGERNAAQVGSNVPTRNQNGRPSQVSTFESTRAAQIAPAIAGQPSSAADHSVPGGSKRTFTDFRIKGLDIPALAWGWKITSEKNGDDVEDSSEEEEEDNAAEAGAKNHDNDDDDAMSIADSIDPAKERKTRPPSGPANSGLRGDVCRMRINFAAVAHQPPVNAPAGPRAKLKADKTATGSPAVDAQDGDNTAPPSDAGDASEATKEVSKDGEDSSKESSIVVEPAWTPFSKGPPQSSTNRISISYAGTLRRLTIDAEIVKELRVFRAENRAEIIVDVTTAPGARDSNLNRKGKEWVIAKGILLETRDTETDSFGVTSRRQLEHAWANKTNEEPVISKTKTKTKTAAGDTDAAQVESSEEKLAPVAGPFNELPPLFRLLEEHDVPDDDGAPEARGASQLIINVQLDRPTTLEDKWLRSGDVGEWLSALPAFSTRVSEPVWQEKIHVADPDPLPTVSQVCQDWTNKSSIGTPRERRRFIADQLQGGEAMHEIVAQIMRNPNNPALSKHEVAPPLLETFDKTAFSANQNHLALAALRLLDLIQEYGAASGTSGELILTHLNDLIMALPTTVIFKALDALWKEAHEKQRIADAERKQAQKQAEKKAKKDKQHTQGKSDEAKVEQRTDAPSSKETSSSQSQTASQGRVGLVKGETPGGERQGGEAEAKIETDSGVEPLLKVETELELPDLSGSAVGVEETSTPNKLPTGHVVDIDSAIEGIGSATQPKDPLEQLVDDALALDSVKQEADATVLPISLLDTEMAGENGAQVEGATLLPGTASDNLVDQTADMRSEEELLTSDGARVHEVVAQPGTSVAESSKLPVDD
ncbi:hypothetical protein CBOM_04458 [Ceraceosorus bombacis]|uniref:Uncharacterized protein n=1 Tax=Ceraceosorus bombacis TaxID=401625 RepID=A0A0N7LB03_9BASI|nr:hypothetical protein CBOM_04458 [Ceraceosorus bombacis]